MLSLISLWAVSGLAFFIVGAPILSWSGMQVCLTRTEDRIFVAVWLGMVVFANVLLLASLFVPLTLYVAGLLIMVLFAPPFLGRSRSVIANISINRMTVKVLLAVILADALFMSFSRDSFYDTGLYHHQMVDWLSEYGSVPGLALIHNRFGFTSSWFALIAPLQTGILKDRLIVGMNSFVFILMMLQAVVMLGRVFERRAGIDDWFFIFAFALFSHYFFSDTIYSLSPDLPAALLVLEVTWLIFTLSINNQLKTTGDSRGAGGAVLILASGAISIKLSLVPLLAVAIFYYLFAQKFSLRKVYRAMAIITPFFAILMCVSVVTSGCPLYPAPYFCTDLPWSLGSDNARNMSAEILEFAKWFGSPPSDATSFNWLWHKPTTENHFNDKFLMMGLLAANVLSGGWLSFKRRQIGEKVLLYVAAIALVGIIFTMVKAPHLRFGLSYFMVIPALACASLLLELSGLVHWFATLQIRFKAILLFLMLYLSILPMASTYKYLFWRGYQANTVLVILLQFADEWELWPAHPILPKKLISAQTNNVIYTYAVDELCWGAQIPCAPGKIGRDVWLRDESAGPGGGFIKKLPE